MKHYNKVLPIMRINEDAKYALSRDLKLKPKNIYDFRMNDFYDNRKVKRVINIRITQLYGISILSNIETETIFLFMMNENINRQFSIDRFMQAIDFMIYEQKKYVKDTYLEKYKVDDIYDVLIERVNKI